MASGVSWWPSMVPWLGWSVMPWRMISLSWYLREKNVPGVPLCWLQRLWTLGCPRGRSWGWLLLPLCPHSYAQVSHFRWWTWCFNFNPRLTLVLSLGEEIWFQLISGICSKPVWQVSDWSGCYLDMNDIPFRFQVIPQRGTTWVV